MAVQGQALAQRPRDNQAVNALRLQIEAWQHEASALEQAGEANAGSYASDGLFSTVFSMLDFQVPYPGDRQWAMLMLTGRARTKGSLSG